MGLFDDYGRILKKVGQLQASEMRTQRLSDIIPKRLNVSTFFMHKKNAIPLVIAPFSNATGLVYIHKYGIVKSNLQFTIEDVS